MAKNFHLGDILSITTGRPLSPKGVSGIYEILNYLTGDNLFRHTFSRAHDECAPWLLQMHPYLSKDALAADLAELDRRIDEAKRQWGSPGVDNPNAALQHVVDDWVLVLIQRFGRRLRVEPIPRDDHESVEPIEELERRVTFTPQT
jgi:hypothetical protein